MDFLAWVFRALEPCRPSLFDLKKAIADITLYNRIHVQLALRRRTRPCVRSSRARQSM